MKKKELKNLAIKIAEQENILSTSTDVFEIEAAKDTIIRLTSMVDSLDDLFELDEMIQKIIS